MDQTALEEELGRSIRALRVAQRLRQVDLASQANVSIGALRSLEAGRGSSTATLVRVVHTLGRDAWLRQLAPSSTFSPLELLEQRRTRSRTRVTKESSRGVPVG
jgi:transcriptional regulator with XRE-family HTH domain